MTRLIQLFALLIALGVTAPLDAAFITYASGNTNPGLGATDATVNFAILTNDGSAATGDGDTFGTGDIINTDPFSIGFDKKFVPAFDSTVSVLDITAQYLYLFQVVNNGTNVGTNEIREVGVTLHVGPANLTSHGYFAEGFVGVGLTDDGGEVNAGNNFGDDGSPFTNFDPENLDVSTPGVVDIIDGYLPIDISKSTGAFLASFFLTPMGGTGDRIDPDDRSVLFGFTTNSPPVLDNVYVVDGGLPANGTTITPALESEQSILVPEPASLMIWSLGALGLTLLGLRQRKTKD